MSSDAQSGVTLHADQEHGGLRFAVFVTLFIAYILAFQLVRLLLLRFAPEVWSDYAVFLACIGALPFALFVVWLVEMALKRYWHSGTSLELNTASVTLHARDIVSETDAAYGEPAIIWSQNFSQINWHFRLAGYARGGRERRVPAKWQCVATELQQDDTRINVYTFLPPEMADALTQQDRFDFHLLNPAELYDTSVRARIGPPSRPSIPNHLLHSKDGRYWLAERRRWLYGIELSSDDFITLLTSVPDSPEATESAPPAPVLDHGVEPPAEPPDVVTLS